MNKTLFILLGAAGDLARKKLFPALYHLVSTGQIPQLHILGAAFENVTAAHILQTSRPFMHNVDELIYDEFVTRFSYYPLADGPESLKKIAAIAQELADRFGLVNRVVYCATPARTFGDLTQQLVNQKIIWRENSGTKQWCRVIFEKPFGEDLKSAHELNSHLAQLLSEQQIYRVDHYLGKDIIGTISLLRFTNRIFEPLWNADHVAWVEIVLSETVGAGHRTAYYDAYGALKDMVQNHMLQILALIAMEMPRKLEGADIQNQKAAVLSQVTCVDGILGQYEGYLNTAGIKENSITPTFAALKLMIDTKRWQGVPFYLKTGKTLNKHETKIILHFKKVDCLLSRQCPSPSDTLIIQIYPEPGFGLMVNVKKPGLDLEVEPVFMDFCYEQHFGAHALSGYEAVLLEVLRGDRSISVRFDEIEYAWAIVDSIINASFPVYSYKQGSNGPQELEDFAQRNTMRWHV